MDPRLLAILTVFVIGVISFLIGWLLTSTKWKKKYFDEVQLRKQIEAKSKKQKTSLEQSKKLQQESRNRVQLINADIRLLEKEIKQLKKDKELLRNKLYNKPSSIYDTPKNKNVSTTVFTPVKVEKSDQKQSIDAAIKGPNKRTEGLIKELKTKEGVPFAINSIFTNKLDPIINRVSIFSSSDQKDDLQEIKGINKKIAKQLKEAGFFNFKQIAMLTAQDLDDISDFLGLPEGQAMNDAWVAQAKILFHTKYPPED